ncbi:MAG: 3'-5' exonuclease [Verrucomicrobia bacterium]|nr:3'-5' exonuclease [Verrucomicrobiota bacterium]
MLGVFLDTETNGLDWLIHEILEIAYTIVDLKTGATLFSYVTLVQISEEAWQKSSQESLRFTGITKEEMQKGKPKEEVAKEILRSFKKFSIKRGEALFICQNPSFDRIFFTKLISQKIQEKESFPYNWLDLASMFWAEEIKKGKDPEEIELSKDKIAAYYGLEKERRPHRALAGVDHLILCYKKVVYRE